MNDDSIKIGERDFQNDRTIINKNKNKSNNTHKMSFGDLMNDIQKRNNLKKSQNTTEKDNQRNNLSDDGLFYKKREELSRDNFMEERDNVMIEQPKQNTEKDISQIKEKRKQNQKLQNLRREIKREQLRHDIRDTALGEISGIPDADLDYNELDQMSKSGIRDSAELVSESLENDNIPSDIENIKNDMIRYAETGRPTLQELKQHEKDFHANKIAEAFALAAIEEKEKHIPRMMEPFMKIAEAFDFDQPRYENAFDRLRDNNRDIDRIMDKLDYEFGIERE